MNVPNCHYYEKTGHAKKDCHNKTREEKSINHNNKDNKKNTIIVKTKLRGKGLIQEEKVRKESSNNVAE